MPIFPFRIDMNDEFPEGYDYSNSDPYTNRHYGLHLLFAGCSVTAGEALVDPRNDTWARKTYIKIAQDNPDIDGYYNVAYSGSTIGEQIDQIFKYCRKYGNPDAIFFLMPNVDRDGDYLGQGYEQKHIEMFLFRMYQHLDWYCKSHGIELYSFTWAENVNDGTVSAEIIPDGTYFRYWPADANTDRPGGVRPTWAQQLHDMSSPSSVLAPFDTYYFCSLKDLEKGVFKYHLKNRKTDKYTIMATDDLHQGTAYHDFWADFIYEKYKARRESSV